jgi:uncharacterized membrane protein YedE/YeeE
MDSSVHLQVLLPVFAVAVVMGAIVNKTGFCTMGAVSDWVNIGDTGRMRAWVFAMAVAIAGVLVLRWSGLAAVGSDTFPPYRSATFAWLRHVVGGVLFGIGMTLASGCGNKTLIRVGTGNLKSVVVLVVAALCAYLMVWTEFYARLFAPWVSASAVQLEQYGAKSQGLGDLLAAWRGGDASRYETMAGAVIAGGLLAFVFASRDFRRSGDNVLGGAVVGLAVVAGWYITGGSLGTAWQELAEFSPSPPSRVETQSYTFISPMADLIRYLTAPRNWGLVNFGIMAMLGVLAGSLLYALWSRSFRVEWFADGKDFARHAAGGALIGIGGVLAMGCTIGQAITGVSTLALGPFLTFAAIVAGAAGTMRYQYWRMLREA